MGLPKNYFKSKMDKLNYEKNGNGYRIKLNFSRIGEKLDFAQDVLDAAVWDSVRKRMPLDTGSLQSETAAINVNERGRVFLFPPNSDYGHYQYEGIVYVDPIYHVGAFYSPSYGFWSRPGVQKIPSDRQLQYSQPDAVSHWGEVAIQEDLEEWYKVVQRALS